MTTSELHQEEFETVMELVNRVLIASEQCIYEYPETAKGACDGRPCMEQVVKGEELCPKHLRAA
jgi:hypothetical protein